MVEPRGAHGFFVVDPARSGPLPGLIGGCFASGEADPKSQTDPEGHRGLAQQSGPDGE